MVIECLSALPLEQLQPDEVERLAATVRRLQEGLRARAAQVEEARARALGGREGRDAAHVLLQNVECEVHHYERQIRARKRFRSKFSEEEVGVTGEGTSAEVVGRLEGELEERRRLKARVEELGEEKNALRGKVTEELDTLKTWERDFGTIAAGVTHLREAVGAPGPASPGKRGEGKGTAGEAAGGGAEGGAAS